MQERHKHTVDEIRSAGHEALAVIVEQYKASAWGVALGAWSL